MGMIRLNSNFTPDITLVSNTFIDKYLPQADGSYVKVYLYLLRCLQGNKMNTGISDIADILETSERDILRAISYWEKNNLMTVIKDTDGEICELHLSSEADTNLMSSETSYNTHTSEATCSSSLASSSFSEHAIIDNVYENIGQPANLTANIIDKKPILEDTLIPLEALLDDDSFLEMKIIIERMLERPINSIEQNLIINLYTKYHFKAELVVHLFEYCLENNKKSSSLIEKIGMDWANNGINTVEKAIAHTIDYSDVYYGVMKAFGINNRTLGSSEKDFVIKWSNNYGYGADIITTACSKTLSAIHQQSFEYADKIITEWYKSNVRSMTDIENLQKKHDAAKLASKAKVANMNTTRSVKSASSFNFEQRDYSDEDYEALEKRAFSKYLNQ